jgi:ferrochelatase
VRRYLRQFLSDRRVVELPPLLWQPILNGAVLTTRPRRRRRTTPRCGATTDRRWWRSRGRRRRRWRGAFGDRVIVDWAMRYGNPAMAARLEALQAQGCDRVVLVPMYPQYSLATTGTVLAEAFAWMGRQRWMPAVRTVAPWYDHPEHIRALAATLRDGLAALDFEPELVVASFHGMPRATLDKGDPYHCQCRKTARLLGEAMGWEEGRLLTTFQSRFGRAEWLKPYTEPELVARAGAGLRRVALICPGFAADCLETLEEIRLGAREAFEHAAARISRTCRASTTVPKALKCCGASSLNRLAGGLRRASTALRRRQAWDVWRS